jgi:hypothetical protein
MQSVLVITSVRSACFQERSLLMGDFIHWGPCKIKVRITIYRVLHDLRHNFRRWFLSPFWVKSVTSTWVWFSSVTELWVRKLRYLEYDKLIHRNKKWHLMAVDICPLCFHKRYISCVSTHGSQGLRSGDRGGQFCGFPRPVQRPGKCFRCYFTWSLRRTLWTFVATVKMRGM